MTIDETMAVDLNAEPTNILTGRVVQKAHYYELVTRSASFDASGKMVGGIAVTSRYPTLPEYADVKVNQALEITSAGTKPQEIMDLFSSVQGVTKVELIMSSGDSVIGYFNGGDN
jgi:hypothetical protein